MLMLLRNSDGKSVFNDMPGLQSALGKICMLEVIRCKIAEFRSSMSLFRAARIDIGFAVPLFGLQLGLYRQTQ